jgi:hypothetical protein
LPAIQPVLNSTMNRPASDEGPITERRIMAGSSLNQAAILDRRGAAAQTVFRHGVHARCVCVVLRRQPASDVAYHN